MKKHIFLLLMAVSPLALSGSAEKAEKSVRFDKTHYTYVASQHGPLAQGPESNFCDTLYREDGQPIQTPAVFKVSPSQAVQIASDKVGFSCAHKLGAQLFADDKQYYLVRLGYKPVAIVDGITGNAIKP